MMIVSMPGAMLAVFVDEASLKGTIENLQNLLKEHQDGAVQYPGVYGISSSEVTTPEQLGGMCGVTAKMVRGSGFMPKKS